MVKFTQVNNCSGDRTGITNGNKVDKNLLSYTKVKRILSGINTERI